MLFYPGYYYFFERLTLCRTQGRIPGYISENAAYINHIQHFSDWCKLFYGLYHIDPFFVLAFLKIPLPESLFSCISASVLGIPDNTENSLAVKDA